MAVWAQRTTVRGIRTSIGRGGRFNARAFKDVCYSSKIIAAAEGWSLLRVTRVFQWVRTAVEPGDISLRHYLFFAFLVRLPITQVHRQFERRRKGAEIMFLKSFALPTRMDDCQTNDAEKGSTSADFAA